MGLIREHLLKMLEEVMLLLAELCVHNVLGENAVENAVEDSAEDVQIVVVRQEQMKHLLDILL